jgi:hypothetical protein
MKRIVVIAVLLGLVIAAPAFSQPSKPVDQKSLLVLKELFQQLRDYAQTNIIPKMKELKTKLDNSMSSDDLQSLNKLRDQATQMKEEGKKDALLLKKAWTNNNIDDVKLYAGKIKELKNGRDDLLKALKPLGLKYKTTLEELGNDAKPSAKVWQQEVMKIVAGWYLKHQGDLTANYRSALAKGLEKLKTVAGLDAGLKTKLAAARFMLWDGNDLPELGQFFDGGGLNPDKTTDGSPAGYVLEANYPNPFNPSTTISFSIPQAQHVSLIVFDALGREVATLVDSELGAGSHSVTFDGKNLSSGVYVYRIRAGDASTGSERSFVQEKKMQLVK